jgi:hypothetical protein
MKGFTKKQSEFLDSLIENSNDLYVTTCSYECMAHERRTALSLEKKGFITIDQLDTTGVFEVYLTDLGVILIKKIDSEKRQKAKG